jgi:hypothetical protein
MDLLRMTAVALGALGALGACSAAGAEPNPPASDSPSQRPAGWKQLPVVASAAGAAVKADQAGADGVALDTVDAWGEPALGCYAVWLALHGGAAAAPALADQVLDGVLQANEPRAAKAPQENAKPPRHADGPGGASGSKLSLDEVVKPSGADGVLAFSFARPPYRGRVRAHLGSGRITAIACFGNQREPATCEAACTRVLQGVP